MKAGLVAPLYLSVSWTLTFSYQLLTINAVNSIKEFLKVSWPIAGTWLESNVGMLVFIYTFTWIFVLSSVFPQVVLGKHRSVIVQYAFVLVLTLLAFYAAEIVDALSGIHINEVLQANNVLANPLLAGAYLLVPYVFMIGIDLRSRRQTMPKSKDEKEKT